MKYLKYKIFLSHILPSGFLVFCSKLDISEFFISEFLWCQTRYVGAIMDIYKMPWKFMYIRFSFYSCSYNKAKLTLSLNKPVDQKAASNMSLESKFWITRVFTDSYIINLIKSSSLHYCTRVIYEASMLRGCSVLQEVTVFLSPF